MIIAQKFPKFRFFRRLKTIGCGCLIIFILFIILAFIFGGLIIRKLISGTITQQTGIVQTNTDNNGQSFIDPKTGATTSLGINKIPDSFPKDFPVYPGSTITMSRTGSDTKSGGQNFWLTMVTNDGVEKVSTY